MPTLRAWQHIYANVERDRSPAKTAGFQTLFYSHEGLTKQDIAEMEMRVFYVFGEYNPVKRVFFHLTSGKVCIGQVMPVAGKDTAGREGLYLAHTLVFPTSTFQAADLTPFDFFRANLFVASVDDAFNRGNAAVGDNNVGDINAVEITLNKHPFPQSIWPPEAFQKLVQLAINHEMLARDRAALALVGSADDVENTLAAILQLIPPQLLPDCTFDTFFERGGNLSFTYCWAAGFQSQPRQPVYCVADLSAKTILNAGNHDKPVSAYGRWVDKHLGVNNLRQIESSRREAFQIARYLEAGKGDVEAILSLDTALINSVLQANEALAAGHIRRQINTLLPDILSDKIYTTVYASLSEQEIITAINNGFEADALLNHLYTGYQHAAFRSPEKDERQALAEVLQKHKHKALGWLLLIWGGASWENPVAKWRIQGGLKEMDDTAYSNFWRLAAPAQLVDVMDLLVDGKEVLFATLITQHQLLAVEEVPRLVKQLIKADKPAALDVLTAYLGQLNAKQIKKIKRYTHGVAGIPPAFLQALDS